MFEFSRCLTVLVAWCVGLSATAFGQAPEIAWLRQYGAANYDYVSGVGVDGLGNVYAGGHTGFSGGIPYDAVVTKFDPAGSQLWQTMFGTPNNDFANYIQVDRTGNSFVSGYSDRQPHVAGAHRDAFVSKVSNDGTVAWFTEFGSHAVDRYGNDVVDVAGQALVDRRGIVLVPGSTGSDLRNPPPMSRDAFVAKFDGLGQAIHTDNYATNNSEAFTNLAFGFQDDLYATGIIQDPPFHGLELPDVSVSRLDLSGNVIWSRRFGGVNSDVPGGLVVNSQGVYVAASIDREIFPNIDARSGDFELRKYDWEGNLEWSKVFGTDHQDYVYDMVADSAGALYVAGSTSGEIGGPFAGGLDAFVIKLDPSGEEVWSKQFGTEFADYAYGLAVDELHNVYFGGSTEGSLAAPSAGGLDAFVGNIASGLTLCEIIPLVMGDDDGNVDITDLNNVRNNFGASGLGDTNGDLIVDIHDLNNVRNCFAVTPNPVPEPSGVALATIGLIAMGRVIRRRKRR